MKKEYSEHIPLFFILIVCPVLSHVDNYLPGITSGFIGTLIFILWGGVILYSRKIFYFNKLDLIFLTFIVYYAGLTLFRNPPYDKWPVIQIITFILLYFYCRNIHPGKNILFLLFIAGIFQACWSILQIQDLLPSYHYLFKGTGSFFNPALSGIFQVISVLSGIVLYDKKFKTRTRLCFAAGFILLFSCILFSNSRAAWFALLTGSCLILFIKHGPKITALLLPENSQKRLFRYTLGFLSTGIIIVSILYGLYVLRPGSVHGRVLIWQVIMGQFTEAPWFGQGPLEASYMPAQAGWFKEHPDSSLGKVAGNNIYAFNEFLRIGFETGLTGLVLFVSLILTGGYYALKGNQLSRYASGLLLAIMCFGLFSYPFSSELITMVAIILLALQSQQIPIKHSLTFSHPAYARWIIFLSVNGFLTFTVLEYIAEKEADLILANTQQDPAVLSSNRLPGYYLQLAGNPGFVLCYGKTLFNNRLYTEALPVLERAFRLKPSSQLVCDLGKCYQYMKKYTEAEQAYSLASFMTPAYILPQYYLFCLYQETGDLKKAKEKAEYILTMPVKVVNTSVLRSKAQARNFIKNHSFSE